MNDRFKFRVWNKRTEEMLDVRLISYFSTGNICRVEAQNAVGDIKILDDYKTSIEDIELIQSTGLKDKNGKLIFEGDVVSIDDGELKGIAQRHDKFDEYYGCIEIKLICKYTTIYKPTVFTESEVIGNIYENKELLNDMENN